MPAPVILAAVGARTGRRWLGAGVSLLLVLVVPAAVFLLLFIGSAPSSSAQTCGTPGTGTVEGTTLSESAKANAAVIAAEGIRAGVGTRGVIIALAAALQESGLENLNYGDRDSLGLFQQRPSAGWGTPEQIRTPNLSAQAFYGVATHTNNRGLTDIPGWSTMPLTQAAQAVQVSAFPDAYAKWEPLATDLATQLVGNVPISVTTPTSTATPTIGPGENCYPGVGATVSGDWANPLPAGSYTLSSPFGPRFHPIYHEWRMHNGQDMAAPEGTQIFAACNGAVIFTGMSGGAGNLTAIDCGGGVQTRYMHQSRITVNVGQPVKAGDPIGLVGNTGASTGAHLHFEVVIGGTAVDPVPFMARQGITL